VVSSSRAIQSRNSSAKQQEQTKTQRRTLNTQSPAQSRSGRCKKFKKRFRRNKQNKSAPRNGKAQKGRGCRRAARGKRGGVMSRDCNKKPNSTVCPGQAATPGVPCEGQTVQSVTGQELTSVAPKLMSSRRYGRTAQPGAITGLETEEKATF